MPLVRIDQAISIDGFTAGPDQSLDHPLGVGGKGIMQYQFAAGVGGQASNLEEPPADLTVDQNIRLGAYLRTVAEARQDRERWLTFFPRLRERLSQQAGSLSGGEQQMLAITRALMLRPRLLLLDEPSLGLAPIITQGLFRTLAAIREEAGMTMLIVEQSANLALEVADSGVVLESGQIVLRDSAQSLAGNDEVRRIYLGYE